LYLTETGKMLQKLAKQQNFWGKLLYSTDIWLSKSLLIFDINKKVYINF
jgi:hypothetical protein